MAEKFRSPLSSMPPVAAWVSFRIAADPRVCDAYAVPSDHLANWMERRASTPMEAVVVDVLPHSHKRVEYRRDAPGIHLPPEASMGPYFMRQTLAEHRHPHQYL